ncbi:MAG: AAA family ATPase [Thermodesulfobacteriota bacterium]
MELRRVSQIPKVPLEELRWKCDPDCMGFLTTDEVAASREIVGQLRGLEALKVGLEIEAEGYNIYVCGASGTGRSTSVRWLLDELKEHRPTPDDLCYVNNFKDPDRPKVLAFPPGQGKWFKREMERLVESLRSKIPKLFESDVYQERKKSIIELIRSQEKSLYKEFEKKIIGEGFNMVVIPMGPVSRTQLLPLIDGQPVPWEQLEAQVEAGQFSAERLEQMRARYEELMREMGERISRVRDLEKDLQDRMDALEREMVGPVVSQETETIRSKLDRPEAAIYLEEAERYILEHLDMFRPRPEAPPRGIISPQGPESQDPLAVFQVNLVVDNSETHGAPVVVETYPTYRNLFGSIERTFDPRGGIWRTDFTKIKAGSFVKANGGYLIIQALDALMEPGVWPALKKSIKHGEVEIQSFDPLSFFAAGSLKPEPIKTSVKVIMIGDSEIYYILFHRDDDFKKVFKVKADFDTVMENSLEAVKKYSEFVRKITQKESLPPFHREAVAAIVQHGVRLAGRKNRISTRFHQVADVIREAAYWARKEGAPMVRATHVEHSVENRHWRYGLTEEKLREMILEGTILIDTDGWKVGVVNGLAVYDIGDISFGKPSRITAQTSMGREGIINIERESELGGPIHNKGVQILSGYLRGRYAQDKPLGMSASVCFEQSYSGIEGDSASSTELYAILSSLSGLPIRQDIAVTGSVNQKGEIQPIGGVNEKIEGFFDVCRIKGLTGTQGVMIPARNVQDLMLRRDVVEAVAQGLFSVIPVETVDQGMEVLTGVEAGQRDENGVFPEGTVNYLVDLRLKEMAEGMRQFWRA